MTQLAARPVWQQVVFVAVERGEGVARGPLTANIVNHLLLCRSS